MNLIKSQRAVIDKILDTLTDHHLSPEEGEQILLFIAGLSAGERQASIIGDWLAPVTIGWKFAASSDEDSSILPPSSPPSSLL